MVEVGVQKQVKILTFSKIINLIQTIWLSHCNVPMQTQHYLESHNSPKTVNCLCVVKKGSLRQLNVQYWNKMPYQTLSWPNQLRDITCIVRNRLRLHLKVALSIWASETEREQHLGEVLWATLASGRKRDAYFWLPRINRAFNVGTREASPILSNLNSFRFSFATHGHIVKIVESQWKLFLC